MNDGRIIITELNGKSVSLLMIGKQIRRIHCCASGEISVGTVVIGSVVRYIPSIHAAFIDVGSKTEYYLPIDERYNEKVYLCDREYDGNLRSGELVMAQVTTEPTRQKQPGLSSSISLQGYLCVINSDATGLCVSHKLSRKVQHEWNENEILRELSKRYQIIIRTNAVTDPNEDELSAEEKIRAEKEASELCSKMDNIFDHYRQRTKGSKLFEPTSEIRTFISNIPAYSYYEIVTDQKDIFERLEKARMEGLIPEGKSIRFYDDSSYPITALYSLETAIHSLLEKKVWLKSGSFLYIEQTEALCAIDVNTGKNINGRNKEDTVFRTNMEAADAIAVQLTARNISGMILVDFINMEEQSHIDELLSHMKDLLSKDCVESKCIDITKLGLMEITREKKYKRFSEQWLTY